MTSSSRFRILQAGATITNKSPTFEGLSPGVGIYSRINVHRDLLLANPGLQHLAVVPRHVANSP